MHDCSFLRRVNYCKRHKISEHILTPFVIICITLNPQKESWQSDRMRWTRNPVYPFSGIGGLNPSLSAMPQCSCKHCGFFVHPHLWARLSCKNAFKEMLPLKAFLIKSLFLFVDGL